MSNEPLPDITDTHQNQEPVEPPGTKVKSILQELEVLALSKSRGSSGLDLSKLNEEQTSKLLDILGKNEDNAFEFHSKRLEASKEIELKRIDSSTVNQKTIRIIVVGALIVLPIITLLIMFYNDQYFVP